MSQLSTEPGSQDFPVFSPDGSWVYYSGSDEDGKWLGLFRRKTDSSGGAELVYEGPRECSVSSISPDGKVLVVMEVASGELSPGTGADLSLIQLGAEGERAIRKPWHQGLGQQFQAVVSPNGSWVAFGSTHERQGPRVYVKPIGGDGLYLVSSDNGFRANWSPDGKILYFCKIEGRVMAAEVLSGTEINSDTAPPTFEIGREIKPVLDFESNMRGGSAKIMPDGNSFLMIGYELPEGDEGVLEEIVDDPAVIQVARNFFTELERVAPTKNQNSERKDGP